MVWACDAKGRDHIGRDPHKLEAHSMKVTETRHRGRPGMKWLDRLKSGNLRGLEKPSKSRITHSEINGKNESTVGLSSRKINC